MKFKNNPKKNAHDGPLLACFPRGIPSKLINASAAKANGQDQLSFSLKTPASSSSKSNRVLHGDSNRTEYTAQNYAQDAYQKNVCKYAIGIFDSGKKQVKLTEVNHIYTLQPQLKKGSVRDSTPAGGPANSEGLNEYSLKRRMLVENFGSRKRLRQVKSQDANRVTLDHTAAIGAVNSVLDDRSNQRPTEEGDILSELKTQSLPAFDLETESVNEVYALHGVISQAEWSLLESKQMLEMVKKPSVLEAEKDKYSLCVVHTLRKLVSLERGEKRTSAKCLAYVQLLIDFYKLPRNKSKVIDQLGEAYGYESPSLMEQILRKFTARNKAKKGPRRFDTASKDKLLNWIFIGMLWANKFNVDSGAVASLSKDLKMGVSDVLLYFKEVGCRIDKKAALLTAPLTFPKMKKPGKGQ